MTCLDEEQLLLLLDGGVPPNESGSLEAHLEGCASCRTRQSELRDLVGDLRAPMAVDIEDHVARVMRGVANAPEVRALPHRRPWRSRALTAGLTSALALAASALFLARPSTHGLPEDSSFTARGGSTNPTLARDVGVSLFAGAVDPVRLAPGAAVAPGAAFTATTSNVHPRPAYLLLFAVDSGGTVHWLYPAYTNPTEDPSSVVVDKGSDRALPTSVVLDSPSEGPLRVVALVTETPRHVSEIERRTAPMLTRASLLEGFVGSAVSELPIRVVRAP